MPDTITPPPQPKPLLQQLLSELGIGPKQTSMTPATPPLVTPQNQNSLQTPQQTGVPSVATTTPPPQPKPALPGFPTPVMGNQNVINGALPNMQAPGTTQVAPVPPAVAARERKNKKTDVKRKEGTQLRQVAKQIVDPNAPPQEAQTPFTPAQYQAPQNKGARLIAAGLEMLFGGAPIGGAAAHFLQGQNQKAKDTYTRNEQLAEQQYQVAQQQAAVKFANDKIIWDNNQDVRARGLNPLKKGPDGQPLPFQYPTAQQVIQQTGGKPNDFASEIEAYDKLGALAARNGDTSNMQRFEADKAAVVKQQQDAQTWNKFILQQQFEDRRAANTQSGEDRREDTRENREDARTTARLNAEQTRPLTPAQQIDVTAKANTASREFTNSWNAAVRPKVTQFGTPMLGPDHKPLPAALAGPIVNRLQSIMGAIRQSQDPQGLAQHLSSLTQDPIAKQLLQQYGDAWALQRQAQGQPIVPRTFESVPESTDEDLTKLVQHKIDGFTKKAIAHKLDVSSPQVQNAMYNQALEEVMHETGLDARGGSNAIPGFPG